jgi:hypothetical protein
MFALCCLVGLGAPLDHGLSNVDDIVSDDAEPNPAPHPVITFVPGATEIMSALFHANASLASGPPFLAVAEPTLAFARDAFGRAIGDADALDALCFGCFLTLVGVEGGVGRHQVRRASPRGLVGFDRRNKQIGVAGPMIVNFVVNYNSVLGLLYFHHFAEFVWLSCPAFPNDFGRGLKHAEDLALGARVTTEDARAGLFS